MVVRRLVRLLSVIVLLAAAALFGPSARLAPASAAALPLSSCTASANVILAVDFGHWGGPVLRSCGSTPTTGYTLLNQGGWSSAGTQHDGPAFICRIGYSGYAGGQQYPTAAKDRCVVTPPTSAYWSYWHAAPNSNTWTYSQSGAQSYSPAPGSIDLWTFGATDTAGSSGAPAYSPNSLRETGGVPVGGGSSGPPAGSGGSGSGSGTGSGSGSSGSGSSGSGSSGSGSSEAGAGSGSGGSGSGSGSEAGAAVGAGSSGGGSHSSAASTTSSAPASTSSTARSTASTATKPASPSRRSSPTSSSSASTQPTVVDARPAAAVRHTGGSFAPALGGVVIVLVLAGLAGLQVWRRRRAGAGQ